MDPDKAEEYRALRAELLSMYGRQDSRFASAWAGVGAVLALAGAGHSPEVGFFAVALVVATWRHHHAMADAVVRISVYIEMNIEATTAGLCWEGVNAIATGETLGEARPIRKLFTNRGLSNYLPFGGVVLAATLVLLALQPPPTVDRWLISGALLALSVASLIWVAGRERRPTRHRSYWEGRFRDALGQGRGEEPDQAETVRPTG